MSTPSHDDKIDRPEASTAEGKVPQLSDLAKRALLGVGRNADPAEQLSFLARMGEVLASSLEYERTIEDAAALIVPALADWCTVEILEADGTLRNVAIAHDDKTKVDWARRLREDHPPQTDAAPYDVARSGRSLLYAELPDELRPETDAEERNLRLLRALGLKSAIFVPLQARERTIGLLGLFATDSGRRYDEEDVAYAEQIGRHVGLAVDSARLYGQRENARRQRDQAEALVDCLFSTWPVGMALVDTNLRIVRINAALAAIDGLPVVEHLGRTAADVLPHLAGEIEPHLRTVLETGEPVRNIETQGRADTAEQQSTWLTSYEPVRGLDERISGVAVTVVDVTSLPRSHGDRGRIEERLRHVQTLEAVGRLAGGIAHDFNNLLTAILGYSEFMLARSDLMDDDRVSLREIGRAAERATELTSHLLAFSRRQTLEPTTLDVNDVVADVEGMLGRIIGEEIAVETRLGRGLWDVYADPSWLAHVLLHLVANARDAMPDGGVLTIETGNVRIGPARAGALGAPPGSYVAVSVTDTGVGIPPEVQEQIFEPFFTTKKKKAGAGLGLSSVYGIVRQMAGYVSVRSQPDVGTTFEIFIPRAEESELRQQGEPTEAPAQVVGPQTVLLVEDADIVRDLVERVLVRDGYHVLSARDAEEALRLFGDAGERVDVLVTDVVMPTTSGPELAAAMRKRLPELRVLYTSGFADETLSHQELKHGEYFLRKPFAPEVLTGKLRDVINGEVGG